MGICIASDRASKILPRKGLRFAILLKEEIHPSAEVVKLADTPS